MNYIPKSKYVPTTDQIETGFHEFASNLETEYPGEYEQAPEFSDWREAMHGFKRWHAEEIRKAKEEAWDECDQETLTHIETNGTQTENWPENPYRKKQDD